MAAKAAANKDNEIDSDLAEEEEEELQVDENIPVYEENVINGNFRILEEFTEDLNDPASLKYQYLKETITLGIREILEADELNNSLDYEINIVGFRYEKIYQRKH